MRKIQKGFTLIELLVVIAIIGILAGILFVAIDPQAQTNKAEDAKIKSELASVRTQAALVFSGDGNYNEVCKNENVKALVGVKGTCIAGPGFWVAAKELTDGKYWCVDSSGNTESLNKDLENGAEKCE